MYGLYLYTKYNICTNIHVQKQNTNITNMNKKLCLKNLIQKLCLPD